MFKSRPDMVYLIQQRNKDLFEEQVERVVETLVTQLRQALVEGKRVEIRDFAAFTVNHYPPRKARNPKTGEIIQIGDRFKPAFRPGKKLRDMVNNGGRQEQ